MNKQNKDYFISFRVTAEEKKWIEEHSYGNYRLISDFVRDCVFEKDIVIINGLDEFSAQLRRIGNNINQIARKIHSKRFFFGKFDSVIEGQRKIYDAILDLKGDDS